MSCKEFVELATDYLEGALPQEDARRFDEHMDACPWCSRYFEQLKVTLRTVGRIPEESISADARDALLHAFRDWNTVFPNATSIATLLDKLTHHADVTLIDGESYRVHESQKEAAARRKRKS